jgi:putative membrane protein
MPFDGDTPTPETADSIESWPTNQPEGHSHPPSAPPAHELELAWLHPTSMFFDVLSHGRQNIVPAAIALFSAAKGSLSGLVFAFIIFGLSLLHTAFRYFTLRYQIKNGELTVSEGLIFKRVRTVPLERIQNIDSTQKVLHRIFNVAEVRVETASGKEPEAILRVLSLDRIAQLRGTVFGLKTEAAADAKEMTHDLMLPGVASDQANSPTIAKEAKETLIHQISLGELLRAGLASNRGLLVFGVIVGAYFQFDLEEYFDPRDVVDMLPKPNGVVETVLSVAVVAVLFIVLTRIYGALWYVLRFYGYRLMQCKDDFRVSCGLLTRVTATVPRQRIQFISIHQPFLMRLLGLASIRIETAGGAATEREDATSSMGRRWFIPVIETDKVNEIIGKLRPDLDWNEERIEWMGVSGKTSKRLCRKAVLYALLTAVLGLLVNRPWGWIAGVAVLPLFIFWAVRKSRAMRYAESDVGVAFRSGVLTKKLSLTFFNRIQTIRLDQSPFDRRWKMATLSIDTAAAGPADHRVHVKYLDAGFAQTRYQALSRKLRTNGLV